MKYLPIWLSLHENAWKNYFLEITFLFVFVIPRCFFCNTECWDSDIYFQFNGILSAMQRNLKKIFKKIFYAIIIVGLFQIIGITAIIFLYFNNITDEIQTKLNKEIYLHVQSKAMQQISIIDLFLKSQFDSYRSTIWRTNIQDDINQLSLSITKIYSYNKKKSICRKRCKYSTLGLGFK